MAANPVSDSDPIVSRVETVAVVEQPSQPELRPLHEPFLQPKMDEQALESHEVIELQTFSERKTWIEEKIKFLESLPPIEVFIGLDSLKISAEDIPGLPTRTELNQWMNEHDTIEKETEIFDTGELTKLRQLTKAATQRNLSPADTDVIELTLTTIYALDKLLHLLRDRSDNLEMMSIRLTWEENRRNSWKERRQIIEDLEAFSTSRARWNPSIYEMIPQDTQNTPLGSRRGSVASLASIASDSTANFPTFSRSARFKLAELLSRDAAQFSGKVTSLKHGKVVAAGKALDRLIDHSRKPVPEELLDEQDRLEEKCINELESIGKFTMHLVMQWRKADEIYVETMKDHTGASNLLEEIETAKLYHPTARQSTAFTSRIDTILKRLAVRGDPASSANMFPRPEHFLLPEQKNANDNLINKLSSDIRSANKLARKVEQLAKDYKIAYDAVKQAETLSQSAVELIARLSLLLKQFKEGKPGAEGEGSPPDLHSEKCLDPVSHSMFLAFLPSLLDDTNVTIGEANRLLSRAPSTLAGLNVGPVDTEFKENVTAHVSDLGRLKKELLETRDYVVKQVETLREARRILANINTNDSSLQSLRLEIVECMQLARWQQESGHIGAPTTPESPTSPLASSGTSDLTALQSRLSQVGTEIKQGVLEPVEVLYENTEMALQAYLRLKVSSVKDSLKAGYDMLRLLEKIKEQCSRMQSVKDDFQIIVTQIEDAKNLLKDAAELALQVDLDTPGSETSVNPVDLEPIQDQVDRFINSLSTRVSFVSRHAGVHSNGNVTISHKLKSPHRSEFDMFAGLPFELASLDGAVRTDSNSFAMRLSGEMELLKKAQKKLELATMANVVDHALSIIRKDTSNLVRDFEGPKSSLTTVSYTIDDATTRLHDMLDSVKLLRERRSQILRSMSPTRGILREMDELSNILDTSMRNSFCKPRQSATNEVELQLKNCSEEFSTFEKQLLETLHHASKYQEEQKMAEERRRQEEELQLAKEEAERLRLEQEKAAIKEKQRLLEEQLAEEQRQQEERERKALELAEMERLAKEAAESERIQVERLEAEAEVIRKQKEEKRLAEEEEVRSRLEKERVEMAEKLRVAESLLEEERRLHAEHERESVEALKKQQLEAEQLTNKLQMEMERLAEEQLEAAKQKKERYNQARSKFERSTSNGHSVAINVVDVFGTQEAPSTSKSRLSNDLIDLQTQLLALRRRLRSISSNELLRPPKASSELPSEEQYTKLYCDISSVSEDFQKLRTDTKDANINTEIASLRNEIEECFASLRKIQLLAGVRSAAKACDAALSDLLEHIDSYPAIPLSILSSSHRSSMNDTPEDQLFARLQFTNNIVTELTTKSKDADDQRVESEHSRIQQTWVELQEMALDRISGNKSRPTSAISRASSRSSISHISFKPPAAVPTHPGARKKGSYSNLSVSSIQSVPSSSRGKMLAPPHPLQPKTRRVVSASNEPANRSTSRLSSTSTTRSVSGPLNSSLYGSTFASRQRTTSLTTAPIVTPSRGSISSSRSYLPSETKRSKSPGSEHSSLSRPRSSLAPPRSVSNSSSWSRAPRDSFPAMMPRIVASTPNLKKNEPPARKKYVANPQSKLDVAVGDVVNQLPVGINIEGITESWRDQSGKYWIGNQDPKLCFCRILRSQTVMVRVGGGWSELSRFIKEHFADSFRIAPLPDSPPRPGGAQEENWISSATLLEARALTPPRPPQTPEPTGPFLPSFSLMTPSGHSPHSLKSSPSAKGSPLTPLQFMRRAEPEYPSGILRPVTPSKPPRGRISNANTPSVPRTSVWRP